MHVIADRNDYSVSSDLTNNDTRFNILPNEHMQKPSGRSDNGPYKGGLEVASSSINPVQIDTTAHSSSPW